MRFATVNEIRTKPFPGLAETCDLCGRAVIPKCGQYVRWHWAHKRRSGCDPWHEAETDWHLMWKNCFPQHCQERVHVDERTGEKHIADVKADSGLVVEVQHSPIAEDEMQSRESFYGDICDTHTFADRQETVERAKSGGLSPCSGALFGMGETDTDVLDTGYALRELEPDSVPINFLIPIEGTPLAGLNELTPQRCLRILAVFRLLFPRSEVRIAGGREVHLRSLQPLGLYLANSIFIGDYLTTKGQAAEADLAMIADAGFEIEGGGPPEERPLAEVALKQGVLD